MKKLILAFIFVVGAVAIFVFMPSKQEEDCQYLRIHIRANSNQVQDQSIKLQIKDAVVEYLTPQLSEANNKQEAIEIINTQNEELVKAVNNILKQNGFNYGAKIKVCNEYFPTRTYNNTTLESGFYDAVIIELGSAVGDNWWCVMYPPLCFVNNFESTRQINFKWKIFKWFN